MWRLADLRKWLPYRISVAFALPCHTALPHSLVQVNHISFHVPAIQFHTSSYILTKDPNYPSLRRQLWSKTTYWIRKDIIISHHLWSATKPWFFNKVRFDYICEETSLQYGDFWGLEVFQQDLTSSIERGTKIEKKKKHEEASLTKFTNHLINILIWYWSISLDGFSRHEGPLYTFICITLRTKRASHAHYLFLSIVDVEDNHQTV